MNKYQVMLWGAIVLLSAGTAMNLYMLLRYHNLSLTGAAGIVLGLLLLGNWLTKAYTYICMDCYLRIDATAKDALFALPAGSSCRKIYCPKCRRKTACKPRRISLRAHVY